MTLPVFFDENLAPPLAAMLAAYDRGSRHPVGDRRRQYLVTEERQRFGAGRKDVAWLPLLEKRTIVLSTDEKMTQKKDERRALAEGEHTLVLFTNNFGNLPYQHQVWKFFKWWPGIEKEVLDQTEPHVYGIAENGSVKTKTPTRTYRA